MQKTILRHPKRRGLSLHQALSLYDSEIRDDVRPHPGPLPRGEGEHIASLDNFSILMAATDSVLLAVRHRMTRSVAWLKTRRIIPPLLSAFAFGFGAIASKRSEDGGERVEVRADALLRWRRINGDALSVRSRASHPWRPLKNVSNPIKATRNAPHSCRIVLAWLA